MTGFQREVRRNMRTQEEIDAERAQQQEAENRRRFGRQISMTEGVPPVDGPFIFLMWDGGLVEGVLHRQDGKRVMTHYNLTIPFKPEAITHSAEGEKIVAYAEIADRGRV